MKIIPDQEIILPVVVKVQRPGIQDIIETDLAALEVVTGWLSRYPPIRKHVNLKALLREFSQTVHQEMDYLNEGKNAETFQKNFKRPQSPGSTGLLAVYNRAGINPGGCPGHKNHRLPGHRRGRY